MASILYLFKRSWSRIYCFDLASLTDPEAEWVEMRYPIRPPFRLLGSCRGRLCISDSREIAILNPVPRLSDSGESVDIWNMVRTRKPKFLPGQDPPIRVPCVSVHVFGYDDRNKEYVLLRVVETKEEPIVSVSIYRSKANKWRRLQSIPFYLSRANEWRRLQMIPSYHRREKGVFAHGHLYWMMRREAVQDSALVLLAFDTRTEEFAEVDLPYSIDNRVGVDLAVVGDHLCLIIYGKSRFDREGDVQPRFVNVWIKKDYGLNGPWDRLFSIRCRPWRNRLDGPSLWPLFENRWNGGAVQPLAYSQDGRRVLVRMGKGRTRGLLCWYDLQTRGVQEVLIKGRPLEFEAGTCL